VVLNSAFVGRKHTGYGIAYCIAKAAQRQVILNASVQLGEQGKFIVGVAPAFIDTKPTKKMNTDEAYRARVLAQMSVPTFGTADEVARFVRHLLNDGRYHNGATLDMSGGWAL
jgi:NAD(P)-dependent dehydrogenase (short-subunit alcohol dehydrogenase family)